MTGRRRLALAVLLALAAAGCRSSHQGGAPAGPGANSYPPAAAGWREGPLPAGPGRASVRDVVTCGGVWYLVGYRTAADGTTSPAAWTSRDGGRTWQVLAAEPAPGSVYGPLHQYSAAACVPGRLAALGSATGGSHGMARTSNWYAVAGGPLHEVISAVELYGGAQSIALNRLAGGPSGWVIAGAREDANGDPGAAVWVSPDAVDFSLVDNDPALESRTGEVASATDVTWDGHAWTLVGDRTVVTPGRAGRTAMAWTSADGRTWTRQYAPAAGADADALQRIVPYRGGVLALGLRGNRFGAWRRDAAGRWTRAGAFGHNDATRGRIGVQSLAGQITQ